MGITVWRIIAATPALAFSLWMGLAMWALAPGYVSATVTALWAVMLVVAPTRAGQDALMRLLLPARAPNQVEEGALADSIAGMRQTGPAAAKLGVRVVGMPDVAAAGCGRHNVVVTRGAVLALQAGRLPADQMTALLVSAAGQVVGGATRLEWPLSVLTLPWLPFRVLLQAFMITFGTSRPVRFALKVRGLYAIAAFIQTTLEGHPLIGVGVLATLAATYGQPYAARQVVRRQTRAGDQYAAEQGHGPGLAELPKQLRSCPVRRAQVERGLD
ncbi:MULTISPECIES: hypothetical protein [Propionibacteriales]|uniref:hypothetical protein n=1 Tax=Propionibacteriales TaxID=85009 RepID=UPI002B1FAD12|nr:MULTISPECIES: hypothetical protein [Propionibacteriales]MEA4944087.1 hypothetical protein [Propionicimonas sp.]MEA5054742.1 hypothetical protein [Propionicimonas sp.]MEA5155631.1 hypothetical protein [Raineyella sp.]